jgi:hypothetical protein
LSAVALAKAEDDRRRRVEHLLGVAGGPDANGFDVKTQTWSGPNADIMNRQHRKLLLRAAKEAGIDLENEVLNPEKSGQIRTNPDKSGQIWPKNENSKNTRPRRRRTVTRNLTKLGADESNFDSA